MPGTTRRATLRHPGELQVALSWQEVLGHTDFGLDDSFFEVGGHSLLAAALVRELSRRFGNRAYIHDIYRTPSVRQLAASLARRAGEAPPALDSEPAQELQRDVRLPADVDFSRPMDTAHCWRHGTSCSPAPAG